MAIDFGPVTPEDGIEGRYVIYDTETDQYLCRWYIEDDPPDRPKEDWDWGDWDWGEDGMTLGDNDLQPMYLDQYIIRAVAPRPPGGFPIGVQIGRFLVDGVGFDRVMIVPIVDATETEEGILDFGKAFKLEDYV